MLQCYRQNVMTKRRWRVHIFFRDDISTYGHLDARLSLRKRRVILGRPYRVRMRPSYVHGKDEPDYCTRPGVQHLYSRRIDSLKQPSGNQWSYEALA